MRRSSTGPARPSRRVLPRPPEPLTDAAGVLAIDKAPGWTSHDVVAVIRRELGVERVGHGGTLDPRATGVLPILVGRATKLADRLHGATKVYAAAVVFGMETTTDDAQGGERRRAPPPALSSAQLDDALAAFRGEILQVPPDFAAVKVQGRRAYDVARGGGKPELRARPVRVDRLEAASWRPPVLRLVVVCGSGTYIRSLARDLGRLTGSAAHLGALRRLAVGALDAGAAVGVEAIQAQGREAVVHRLRLVDDQLLALDPRYLREAAEDLLTGWQA